jgi:hypothetical protein
MLLRSLKRSPETSRPEIVQLEDQLTELYLGDFSVFQSMLDHWAIGQPFPIVPIDRLEEQPDKRAILVDLTCDSDGKVSHYVSTRDNRFLPVHPTVNGTPYYLGFFLMGAYEDIIGDAHNLFGRVTEAHVYADAEEPGDFWIEKIIHGTAVQDMLRRCSTSQRSASSHERARARQDSGERGAADSGHGDPRQYMACFPQTTYCDTRDIEREVSDDRTPAEGRARANGDDRRPRAESQAGGRRRARGGEGRRPARGAAGAVRSRYFCQTEDAAFFKLAEAVPGPGTDALAALAKELSITLVASLFASARRGSSTTPRRCSTPTAATW